MLDIRCGPWNNVAAMGIYAALLRPLLFLLPPEKAQASAEWLLKRHGLWHALSPLLDYHDPRLRVEAGGLVFPSPVGLAAGLDKDCEFLAALQDIGFGYAVGGTVVPRPRDGNPKPRLMRLPTQASLINALGFPSLGMTAVQRNLERLRHLKRHAAKPVIASVAGLSLEEFLECHATLEPLADATELNISSPNTQGIRIFQEAQNFKTLLEHINAQRKKPLWVKIPPYADNQGRDHVLTLVRLAKEHGVNAVTASNTKPVEALQLAPGRGGLSGRSVFDDTLRIVPEVRAEAGHSMSVNACGGIATAEDALRALKAGANTVQLLTAMVYQGPSVVGRINRGLVRLMEKQGAGSIQELARATVP